MATHKTLTLRVYVVSEEEGFMQTVERGPSDASTTMILTEAGSSYFFRRNQRLQRFRLVDGREDYGLRLHDYNPLTLDKLVSQGMVRKLEFPVYAVRADRKLLLQYVTTVGLGFFTQVARVQLRRTVENSKIVRELRRFPDRPDLAEHEFQSEDGNRRDMVNLITRKVLAQLHEQRKQFLEDDPFKPLIGRFLSTIPESAWRLLAGRPDDAAKGELLETITHTVSRFVLEAGIADYLALVWVELMGHLQYSQQTDSVPAVYLLSQLKGVGFDQDEFHTRRSHQLHMMAGTGDIQFMALKADLEHIVSHAEGGTQTYEQFYRRADTNHDDLALYYLGFLEDACQRLGLHLRAFVRGGHANGILNIVITTDSDSVEGTL